MINTIVVGGGQAGITLSYYLQQRGVEHLVLERDRAFSAWHNCWDSFRMNTANWMNTLPGMQKPFAPHKAWYDTATREEALDYFCAYRQMVNPPLKEGVTVTQVAEGENIWNVHTDTKTYQTTNVAICTGHAAQPFVPDTAKNCRKQPPSYTHQPIETPTRSQRQMSSSSAAAAVGFKSAWTWHNRINLKTSHLHSAATASSHGLYWASPSAYSRACSQYLKSSDKR